MKKQKQKLRSLKARNTAPTYTTLRIFFNKFTLLIALLVTLYFFICSAISFYISATTEYVRGEICDNGSMATNCAVFGYGVRIPNGVAGVTDQSVNDAPPLLGEQDKMTLLIKEIAKEENFDDPQLLIDLAWCESRLNPYAVNGHGNSPAGSVDRGLFMFNDYWQPQVSDECSFSPECATRTTINKIKAGGLHLWVCAQYI